MENQNTNDTRQKSGNDVKDTLFRKLFSEKERAIELCNALEGTNYPPAVAAFTPGTWYDIAVSVYLNLGSQYCHVYINGERVSLIG